MSLPFDSQPSTGSPVTFTQEEIDQLWDSASLALQPHAWQTDTALQFQTSDGFDFDAALRDDSGHAHGSQQNESFSDNSSQPTNYISALYIGSNGEIMAIDQNPEAAGNDPSHYPPLFFLGFFVQLPTLPLFTDHRNLPQSAFDNASIALVGVVRKSPASWLVHVYSPADNVAAVRADLLLRTIAPVQMVTDVGYTCATRVYELPFDDTQFEPWELGRNNSHIPATHRPHGTSQNEQQTNEPTLKRTRRDSIETQLPLLKKPKDVSIGTLKDNHPEIHTVVVWAKGYFRSHCLLNEPYPTAEQKLLVAEDSYTLSLVDHPINSFPGELCLDELLVLVAKEHSVFRSNSVDRAGEIIHAEFPPDLEISAVEVVRMLEAVYGQNNSADNFFASRKPATSVSGSGSHSHSHSGSEFETAVDCPFAHSMIGNLLYKLFSQKVKNCGNVAMWDLVKETLKKQEDLSISTVTYAQSLLLDAFINRFRRLLATLPRSTIKHIVPRRLDTDADGFKFIYLRDLRTTYEDGIWGNMLRANRKSLLEMILSAASGGHA